MSRFCVKKNGSLFVIEEDIVGWYLIVYKNAETNVSSEDFLLDTKDDAFLEANERFGIPRDAWELAE